MASCRCLGAVAATVLAAFVVQTAACAGPDQSRSRPTTSTQVKTATVTVIALSDFHGWLRPLTPRKTPDYFGGIGNLAALITGQERVDGRSAVLVDNGDMWTGQTEATLLKGEPVVAIYNVLGFAAANVANHEFDFGREALEARAQQAEFPFLGANIYSGKSQRPSFVRPWTIVDRQGVKVGIIGLSYIDTPKTTLAKNVEGLEFRGYAETLRAELPALRQAGAEVIVVLLHDTVDQAAAIFADNPDLSADMVVAGQNHRKERKTVRGIPVVNPGAFGRSFARFDVAFDASARRVLKVVDRTVDVQGEKDKPPYPQPPKVRALVEQATRAAESMTSVSVGRLAASLTRGTFGDSLLGNFVVDSWLAAFPEADFAIVNHGGLRQDIEAGPVNMGDLLSTMPFENNILTVQLTGAQIKRQLTIDQPVVGGLTWTYRETDGERVVVSATDRKGQAIDDATTYDVLIIDFLYSGGDGFEFGQLDPTPEDSGISWREPLIRALRASANDGIPVVPPHGRRATQVR